MAITIYCIKSLKDIFSNPKKGNLVTWLTPTLKKRNQSKVLDKSRESQCNPVSTNYITLELHSILLWQCYPPGGHAAILSCLPKQMPYIVSLDSLNCASVLFLRSKLEGDIQIAKKFLKSLWLIQIDRNMRFEI